MTQHCPVCNTQVNENPRYPDYVCGSCVYTAQSEDGQAVKFHNIDLSGGCVGMYVETEKVYDSNICYIHGIECFASEAYMGGIVVRPVKNNP